MCCSVLQCVAVCFSVLQQCDAVCCSAMQWGAVCWSVLRCVSMCHVTHVNKWQAWATVCTYMSTHAHTHTHSHTHTCADCTHTYMYKHINTHTHARANARNYMHTRTRAHTRKHTHAHANTRTHLLLRQHTTHTSSCVFHNARCSVLTCVAAYTLQHAATHTSTLQHRHTRTSSCVFQFLPRSFLRSICGLSCRNVFNRLRAAFTTAY